MTIDEEIKRFFLEQDIKLQIMPFNMLPVYLQKIQHFIFATHSHLDGDMLVRMLSQIRLEGKGSLTNEAWDKVNLSIQDLLEQIPYLSKVSIIETYGDIDPELIKALSKVNKYRNEFAHIRPEVLIQKYDIQKSQGKINIRDLIRALKRATDLFLEHTENSEACKYYVQKQIESHDLHKDIQ